MAMADLARRSTYDDIDPQDAAAYRMQRKYLSRNVAGSAPADNSAIPEFVRRGFAEKLGDIAAIGSSSLGGFGPEFGYAAAFGAPRYGPDLSSQRPVPRPEDFQRPQPTLSGVVAGDKLDTRGRDRTRMPACARRPMTLRPRRRARSSSIRWGRLTTIQVLGPAPRLSVREDGARPFELGRARQRALQGSASPGRRRSGARPPAPRPRAPRTSVRPGLPAASALFG